MNQHIIDRLDEPGPKRILSLDGGGVRGLVTLGILEQVEEVLSRRSPYPDDFRLYKYFDLIGGTSTGAVIATLLCMGWKANEIKSLYSEMLPKVFKKRRAGIKSFFANYGFETKFDGAQFSQAINDAFTDVAERAGVHPEHLTFETQQLKTLVAIVAKRIDTGSVWVQTNNPRRKFWTPNNTLFFPSGSSFDANRDYNIKTIVEASASAPYFVDPVSLRIDPHQMGLFVDGGASPHNNPSKELFLMATLRSFEDEGPGTAPPNPFGFGWPAGENNIFMLSVGTGYYRTQIDPDEYRQLPELKQAIHAMRSVISDAEQDAVTWMQALSKPKRPWRINGKVENMRSLRITEAPMLTFERYNVELSDGALRELMGKSWAAENLSPIKLKQLHEFDVANGANLKRLLEIGDAAGLEMVDDDHFPADFDVWIEG